MDIKIIKNSFTASLLISISTYGLLKTNYSILSMILFPIGLFLICTYNQCLFTGLCGYILKNKNIKQLITVLIVNLIAGYLIGLIFSLNHLIYENAKFIVTNWSYSFDTILQSFFCGFLMFCSVESYKQGTPLVMFFLILMFIMCGFQHCIANVIIMGAARDFHASLFIVIVGNWLGSLNGYKLLA